MLLLKINPIVTRTKKMEAQGVFEIITYKNEQEINDFLFLYAPPEKNVVEFPESCLFLCLELKKFELRGRSADFFKVLGNQKTFWARTSFFSVAS